MTGKYHTGIHFGIDMGQNLATFSDTLRRHGRIGHSDQDGLHAARNLGGFGRNGISSVEIQKCFNLPSKMATEPYIGT